MAQKINLNASPYYDDFENDKNFHKVLYKPGFPVQARELTTQQSILQNQIENFGDHIFKEGSVVIPGGVAYDTQFSAVKLNNTNFNIDISIYINNFLGKRIRGSQSGIEAIVKFIALPDGVNVTDITIYVTYLTADNNSQFSAFTDGEILTCNENVVYGNTTINANTPFASLISRDATAVGSAAFVSKGVYFVRGFFVNVNDQTIILDHYTNTPSYRVGLQVNELIVNAKEDNSLFDNAKGFSNFAAPGADRLKIELVLTKKLISDKNDTNFFEILRVDEGKKKIIKSKTEYNKIRDWIAERTFDESGDYSVTPFRMGLFNSLNNNLGNNGLFFSGDTTDENNEPSDDLMCLKVSNGEAYVRGYQIEKTGTTIIDVDKPRDVGIRSDVGVGYEMGNLFRVKVPSSGTPQGKSIQGSIVKLHDGFKSESGRANIGSARVYSFNLEDGAYEGSSTNWELRLFDIQTNTDIFLNQQISSTDLPQGSFVKGKNSGASGFAIGAGNNSQTISLNETSGTFSAGEQIQINGVDFPRTVGIATAYAIQDIKGISRVDAVSAFNVDTTLERFALPNNVTEVSIDDNNIVTSGRQSFNGVTPGTYVRYTRSGFSTETFNRVASVGAGGTNLTLSSLTSVDGLFDGNVDQGTFNMTIGAPVVRGTGALFVPLADPNVASVDLSESNLRITEEVTKSASSGGVLDLSISSDFSSISDVIFDTFDQEKYSIFDSNGNPITITNDTFQYLNNGEDIRITNVGSGSKTIKVTLIKNKVKSKIKGYIRSQKLSVTRSKYNTSGTIAVGGQGDGTTQIKDGLVFDRRYGLRVQDEELAFFHPDVVKFLAVYESTNEFAPTLDKLVFTSTANVNTNAVVGENIVGSNSNVIARVVSLSSSNTLEIVYLTSGKFNDGEVVSFQESNINTAIESIEVGLYKDITSSFTLDKGQKNEYYDYSKLVRNRGVSEPSRQLLIVFDQYTTASDDDGDVFTVRSYDEERYSTDIPTIGDTFLRATDTFDFRPRVSTYNPSTNLKSPFDFSNRDFSGEAITKYITPNETSITSYEFYLPRVDKVYINKFGDIVYDKGISMLDPKPPVKIDEVMDLATITLPPYLYNPQDAVISLVDNRRFTMRDIGDIESRVSNLEETTTLSLLEINAQTLQIQDEDGRNRFKTGFFVDPFDNYNFINRRLSTVQINPERGLLTPFRSRNTLASQLTPAENLNIDTLDFNTDFELFDSNVQKTGNVVTLKYEEVEFVTQPYATEIINVNPYELPVFNGDVELDPQRDIWTRTIQLPDRVIRQTGVNNVVNNVINQTLRFDDGSANERFNLPPGTGSSNRDFNGTRSFTESNTVSNTVRTVQNNLVSSSSDDFMRSRNIQFVAEGFVDFVQTYLFLDGQKIFDVIPKLLEITPNLNGTEYGSKGTFKIGEDVHALDENGNIIMIFRLCKPNHKSGAFNDPSEAYFSDPYGSGLDVKISNNYSQSSTVLNVDTKSLAEEAQGDYYGYVTKNSQLVGQESGATAYVKDLRLITDAYGEVIGSVFIRNPHSQPAPPVKIQTGSKEFRITTSPTNERVEPAQKFGVIFADAQYTANGTLEQYQDTITFTTNTTTTVTTTNINITVDADDCDPLAQTFTVGGNVLAPSAKDANTDLNGAFITAVEVYFATVDTVANSPIRCEIRTTVADARPSRTVIGRSKTLKPKGTDENGNEIILIESDPDFASKATKFTFPEPIYLAPGNTYSFVLVAPQSTAYNVWTARHGETAVNPTTIADTNPNASISYNTQYGAGAIFKSQNGSIWTEDQSQDITFKLYKAKFTSKQGSAFFNNPKLSTRNGYIPTLINNPILVLPKTGSIGITTNYDTTVNTKLAAGRKISVKNLSSTAVITGAGSSANSVALRTGGTNYSTTASDTNSVDTFAITGQGSGLKLNLDTSSGSVGASISIVAPGNGYQVGDVVGIVTSSAGNRGQGGQITISGTQGVDTLYLTNIQGDTNSFKSGETVTYFDELSAGTVTSVAMGATGEIRDNTVLLTGGINSGNTLEVNQFNHGMYSDINKVKFIDIESDVTPTILTASLSKTDSTSISVASTSDFVNFEGIPVGAANTGYVKIGNEIIGYSAVTSTNGGELTISNVANNKRGVDGTIVTEHQQNSLVKKHEIGGVSIRRLEVDTQQVTSSSISGLDNYYVSFDRSKNGKDRSVDTSTIPQLSFNTEALVGGSNVKASQNIMYGSLIPRYEVFTPTGIAGAVTGVDASLRSVSGTSVDGTERSFVDEGFQSIQLNSLNVLDSVRVVSSKVNENQYLQNLPRGKSFTTIINMTTNDENISPLIRLSGESKTEFIIDRLNNPIGLDNYQTDNRVNSLFDDPHAAIYVSNTVNLTKAATSLKVILGAFRPSSSDFRVLYSLIRPDSDGISQSFELFPGFRNTLTTDDEGFLVADLSQNDGRPDVEVTPSSGSRATPDQFKEYQFTADNLPEFIGFTIKIVMSGTNQARSPRITELRAIAVK